MVCIESCYGQNPEVSHRWDICTDSDDEKGDMNLNVEVKCHVTCAKRGQTLCRAGVPMVERCWNTGRRNVWDICLPNSDHIIGGQVGQLAKFM